MAGSDAQQAHQVLIVDDNDDARKTLAYLLRARGYEVTEAWSAEDALRHFREGLHPCIVILDLLMPGMDGWAFYDRMRQEADLATIPVIIVSGHLDEMTRADVQTPCHFMLKPAKPDALIAAVEHNCQRQYEHASGTA